MLHTSTIRSAETFRTVCTLYRGRHVSAASGEVGAASPAPSSKQTTIAQIHADAITGPERSGVKPVPTSDDRVI